MTPEYRINLAQQKKGYPLTYDRRETPRGYFMSRRDYEEARDLYWFWIFKTGSSPRTVQMPPLPKEEARMWYLFHLLMHDKQPNYHSLIFPTV